MWTKTIRSVSLPKKENSITKQSGYPYMKYLLNTSFHHKEMLRHITSKFIVTETKVDWSSGYSAILYCLKIELKCEPNYSMFNFRRDMYNKFNDESFIDMLKVSLKSLS